MDAAASACLPLPQLSALDGRKSSPRRTAAGSGPDAIDDLALDTGAAKNDG